MQNNLFFSLGIVYLIVNIHKAIESSIMDMDDKEAVETAVNVGRSVTQTDFLIQNASRFIMAIFCACYVIYGCTTKYSSAFLSIALLFIISFFYLTKRSGDVDEKLNTTKNLITVRFIINIAIMVVVLTDYFFKQL